MYEYKRIYNNTTQSPNTSKSKLFHLFFHSSRFHSAHTQTQTHSTANQIANNHTRHKSLTHLSPDSNPPHLAQLSANQRAKPSIFHCAVGAFTPGKRRARPRGECSSCHGRGRGEGGNLFFVRLDMSMSCFMGGVN